MYEKSMRVGIGRGMVGRTAEGAGCAGALCVRIPHTPLLEPSARIELATFSLRVRCSTN